MINHRRDGIYNRGLSPQFLNLKQHHSLILNSITISITENLDDIFSCLSSIDRNIKSETSIVYNYHLFCSTVTYFTLSHEFNWVRRPKPFTAGWHQLANLLKKNLKRPPLLTSGRSCCIGNIKCEIRPYLWWPRLLYPAMLFMMTFWEM